MKGIPFALFSTLSLPVACQQTSNQLSDRKISKMTGDTTKTTLPTGLTGIKTDTATFGTGCFWCTEAIFQELKGVVRVTSGYTGGHVANPTYEEVCSGTTGHAECLQIVYDPSVLTFDQLLHVFWESHDPTTLNRQGNDIGTQYRSAVFYHTAEQKEKAEHYKSELNKNKAYDNPIVTEITAFSVFYPAEDYHQDFYINHSSQRYFYLVLRPKVVMFEKAF
jgi:peptide-methionine (S)-S-oxide reductase